MSTIVQDLRYAARSLRKQPGFTLIVVATLALGIGANTAIFSLVEGMLLRPLPFPEPERLITVWEDHGAHGGPADEWTGGATFLDWQTQNRTFEELAAYGGQAVNLTGEGSPERLVAEAVTPGFFSVMGVRPAQGRAFTADEGRPEGPAVVILGHELWQRRFGGGDVLGRSVALDGEPHEVVGILPEAFRTPFTAGAELWRPLRLDPARNDRGNYYLRTVGRLRPEITLAQARADLARIMEGISDRFPNSYDRIGSTLIPLRDRLVAPARAGVLAVFGAVGFVLLIACANVANLMLARAASRGRELAVRASLGAGRLRLLRQLLTESVLLALAGGLVGLGLGSWGIDVLRTLAPPGTPRIEDVTLNPAVLTFTFGLALLTALIFGLVPAWRAARLDLGSHLKEGTRSGETGARGRLRSALVVAEVALALTLLVGAGLLLRSLLGLLAVDLGFAADQRLTARLTLPAASYAERPQWTDFYQRLLARLAADPRVTAAGASSILPLGGGDNDTSFEIAGRPKPEAMKPNIAWYRSVTPGYFDAMGMRLSAGRGFGEQDRDGAEPVVVVNESLARKHFPQGDALGQRLTFGSGGEPTWRTIVGVVGDVRSRGPGVLPQIEAFFPLAQMPRRSLALVVATEGDPMALVPSVREEIRALDPELPLSQPRPLAELVGDALAVPRFIGLLLAAFAAVALALAAIGIYGVMAYSVDRRTREIGVRMALGAMRGDVLRLVLARGLVLTAVGLVLGVAAAFAVTRFLESLLYQVEPTDPTTFAATAVLLLAAGLFACWLPASRAARVDPVVSLRWE